MQLSRKEADRLIALSLNLEAAVLAEDWAQVTLLVNARGEILEKHTLTEALYKEVAAIDERMLNELRSRLAGVKADMRNLSTAIKVASPYAKQEPAGSMSVAS